MCFFKRERKRGSRVLFIFLLGFFFVFLFLRKPFYHDLATIVPQIQDCTSGIFDCAGTCDGGLVDDCLGVCGGTATADDCGKNV